MKCPKCKHELRIKSGRFESKKGSTKVIHVLELFCVSPGCDYVQTLESDVD
jgi:ssDNA-binding Zn-finger/Zn-ribbon topoisomerase 1